MFLYWKISFCAVCYALVFYTLKVNLGSQENASPNLRVYLKSLDAGSVLCHIHKVLVKMPFEKKLSKVRKKLFFAILHQTLSKCAVLEWNNFKAECQFHYEGNSALWEKKGFDFFLSILAILVRGNLKLGEITIELEIKDLNVTWFFEKSESFLGSTLVLIGFFGSRTHGV